MANLQRSELAFSIGNLSFEYLQEWMEPTLTVTVTCCVQYWKEGSDYAKNNNCVANAQVNTCIENVGYEVWAVRLSVSHVPNVPHVPHALHNHQRECVPDISKPCHIFALHSTSQHDLYK